MRRLAGLLISLIILAATCLAEVRLPAVAGSFYPADKEQLAYQVERLLNSAGASLISGEITALIVPHAGFQYSGAVAAAAYRQLRGRAYDRVILIGASHQASFPEIALVDQTDWATPLGRVPVDLEFNRKLMKLDRQFVVDNQAHKKEHSLEVQLPFLQTLLPGCRIVPILFGSISLANCQTLAYALGYLVDDRTLVVVSTDWSHYYPPAVARKLDSAGLARVVDNDLSGYVRALSEGETEACGAPGVITALLLAPALGANKTELIKYASSGVGYAAVSFAYEPSVLSADDQRALLKIARQALNERLNNRPSQKSFPDKGVLAEKRGAFVTLTRNNELRGCLGLIQPLKPLAETVREMALAAAFKDSRFQPVTKAELRDLRFEISVLSRLRKVTEIAEIEPGRDGLYVVQGEKSGILLPQVAVEQGWGKEEFLKQVSLKAGLSEADRKGSEPLLYRFSAQVFGE